MARDWRNRLRGFRLRRRDFYRLAFRFFRRHGVRRLGAGLAWAAVALAPGRLGFRCGRRSNGRRPRGGRLRGRRFRLVGRGWRRGGRARRLGGLGRGWVCLWSGGRGVLGGRRGASNGEFTLLLRRREVLGGGQEVKVSIPDATDNRDIGRIDV